MCKYTIFAPKWWYCNARDLGSQLVLFWLLGGCFDKSQQRQSSNHSWAQCYSSEVLLLTSWLLFQKLFRHIPFKEFASIPKHSNAFVSFHSLPLQSYDCPYQCHLLGYSCGTSDAKDSEALWQNSPNSNPFRKEASTFNTIQKPSNKSKNNTIWKTRKHSNEKIKRPVTFFNQEHSMNISNIHKQNKHPTQPKKAFGTANTCLMSGSRAWNTIPNHSLCSLKAALVQKLMDFEFGMSLSRLMSAPRNDHCALLVMKINLGMTAFALCRARRFLNHLPGRRFIEDVWFKERGIALYHSLMALRYGRARLLGRMWCEGRWSWAYLTHATVNTQTRFERRFFLFARALS